MKSGSGACAADEPSRRRRCTVPGFTEDRLDFAVIGPAVNRAARLENLTRQLGGPVLASAEFNAASTMPLQSLGKHTPRGVPEPVEVFTLPERAGHSREACGADDGVERIFHTISPRCLAA